MAERAKAEEQAAEEVKKVRRLKLVICSYAAAGGERKQEGGGGGAGGEDCGRGGSKCEGRFKFVLVLTVAAEAKALMAKEEEEAK
eukprot:85224-Hanusia_phi.AAC.1